MVNSHTCRNNTTNYGNKRVRLFNVRRFFFVSSVLYTVKPNLVPRPKREGACEMERERVGFSIIPTCMYVRRFSLSSVHQKHVNLYSALICFFFVQLAKGRLSKAFRVLTTFQHTSHAWHLNSYALATFGHFHPFMQYTTLQL